ncbi:MAG: GMC family oxidoreductase N-terminal domain-containing protein [Halofilum sp. (in: g-proteobacteria)]|nr:GMC family oxidoreductase N-terminal domain-containing protein [Halofilum sp. (in: g-proteobacteria)]
MSTATGARVGAFDQTIHRGRRWSTANAYLRPALRRANLAVRRGCAASRVLFEDGRAVGVAYTRGGASRHARAAREIVLCAGAINSPCILQRSGIGDGDALAAAGIDVVAHRPGVGQCLQEHAEVPVQYACDPAVSLDRELAWWRRAAIGLRWFLTRGGLGASNHFEAGAFIGSRRHRATRRDPVPADDVDDDGTTAARPGFEGLVDVLRPASRGAVGLIRGPRGPAAHRADLLASDADRAAARAAVRLTCAGLPPARALRRGAARSSRRGGSSDDALDAWARRNAKPGYHATVVPHGRRADAHAALDPSRA